MQARGYEIVNIPNGMTAQFGDWHRLKWMWDFAESATMPVIIDFF